MSALYPPCTPADCSDTGAYVSFIGGSPSSWQQITSTDHPSLVGIVWVGGGKQTTIWTGPGPIFEPPPVIVPNHGDNGNHGNGDNGNHNGHGHPSETPEPTTLFSVGAGFLALAASHMRRRRP